MVHQVVRQASPTRCPIVTRMSLCHHLFIRCMLRCLTVYRRECKEDHVEIESSEMKHHIQCIFVKDFGFVVIVLTHRGSAQTEIFWRSGRWIERWFNCARIMMPTMECQCPCSKSVWRQAKAHPPTLLSIFLICDFCVGVLASRLDSAWGLRRPSATRHSCSIFAVMKTI